MNKRVITIAFIFTLAFTLQARILSGQITHFLKKCEIWIDKLKCYEDGETGKAEPYLWVAYFKVDFENVEFKVSQVGNSWIGKFIKKPEAAHFCDVYPSISQMTSSSYAHGNIGGGWEDGKEKPIRDINFNGFYPFYKDLGELHKIDINMEPLNMILPFRAPFFMGCVVILMEEDSTPNDAVFAGAKEFISVLTEKLDELFTDLDIDVGEYIATGQVEIPDEMLEEIGDKVKDKIKSKIKDYFLDHSSVLELIAGASDPDDNLGSTTQYWLSDSLINVLYPLNNAIPWDETWDLTGGFWNDGKWKVSGQTASHTEAVQITDVSFGSTQVSPADGTGTLYSGSLTFSINIDRTKLKPKYSVKLRRPEIGQWENYKDPKDNNRNYSSIDCSADNNPITIPFNIIVDETSLRQTYLTYYVDVKIELEHPDAQWEGKHHLWISSRFDFDLLAFMEDIVKFEYWLRTKGISVTEPPHLITDAKVSTDDVIIREHLAERDVNRFWDRRIGLLGNIVGDSGKELKEISVSFHLGSIKNPIYTYVNYNKLSEPITWNATLKKVSSNAKHRFTKKLNDFKPVNYNICKDPGNTLLQADYKENNELRLAVRAKDGKNRIAEDSFTIYAKSLIVKYDLVYEEFFTYENISNIVERTKDYIARNLLPAYVRELKANDKEIFLKNVSRFKSALNQETEKITLEMLSDNNIKNEVKKKMNEISSEFIYNNMLNLKKQKHIQMLKGSLEEQNKTLWKIFQRESSKILANRMFIGETRYNKEYKDKFEKIVESFRK